MIGSNFLPSEIVYAMLLQMVDLRELLSFRLVSRINKAIATKVLIKSKKFNHSVDRFLQSFDYLDETNLDPDDLKNCLALPIDLEQKLKVMYMLASKLYLPVEFSKEASGVVTKLIESVDEFQDIFTQKKYQKYLPALALFAKDDNERMNLFKIIMDKLIYIALQQYKDNSNAFQCLLVPLLLMAPNLQKENASKLYNEINTEIRESLRLFPRRSSGLYSMQCALIAILGGYVCPDERQAMLTALTSLLNKIPSLISVSNLTNIAKFLVDISKSHPLDYTWAKYFNNLLLEKLKENKSQKVVEAILAISAPHLNELIEENLDLTGDEIESKLLFLEMVIDELSPSQLTQFSNAMLNKIALLFKNDDRFKMQLTFLSVFNKLASKFSHDAEINQGFDLVQERLNSVFAVQKIAALKILNQLIIKLSNDQIKLSYTSLINIFKTTTDDRIREQALFCLTKIALHSQEYNYLREIDLLAISHNIHLQVAQSVIQLFKANVLSSRLIEDTVYKFVKNYIEKLHASENIHASISVLSRLIVALPEEAFKKVFELILLKSTSNVYESVPPSLLEVLYPIVNEKQKSILRPIIDKYNEKVSEKKHAGLNNLDLLTMRAICPMLSSEHLMQYVNLVLSQMIQKPYTCNLQLDTLKHLLTSLRKFPILSELNAEILFNNIVLYDSQMKQRRESNRIPNLAKIVSIALSITNPTKAQITSIVQQCSASLKFTPILTLLSPYFVEEHVIELTPLLNKFAELNKKYHDPDFTNLCLTLYQNPHFSEIIDTEIAKDDSMTKDLLNGVKDIKARMTLFTDNQTYTTAKQETFFNSMNPSDPLVNKDVSTDLPVNKDMSTELPVNTGIPGELADIPTNIIYLPYSTLSGPRG